MNDSQWLKELEQGIPYTPKIKKEHKCTGSGGCGYCNPNIVGSGGGRGVGIDDIFGGAGENGCQGEDGIGI